MAPVHRADECAADAALDCSALVFACVSFETPDCESLTQLSLALLEDLRAHQLHDFLSATILHCVKSLPQKSMIFVGLMATIRIQMSKERAVAAASGAAASAVAADAASSAHDPDQFLQQFIRATGEALLEACAQGAWNELRLLVRFVAGLGLANLVHGDSVWEMVDRVQSLLTDNVTAAGTTPLPNSQREYLLFMLLSLVPFLAESFGDPRFTQLQAALHTRVEERAHIRRGRQSGKELMSFSTRKIKAPTDENKMQDEETSGSSSSSSRVSTDNGFSFDLIDCWWAALSSMRSKEAYLQDASEVSIQRSSYQCFRVELDQLCKPLPFSTNQLISLVSTHARQTMHMKAKSRVQFPPLMYDRCLFCVC